MSEQGNGRKERENDVKQGCCRGVTMGLSRKKMRGRKVDAGNECSCCFGQ